jgi:tetratricopeptide (TPR) repeat protein
MAAARVTLAKLFLVSNEARAAIDLLDQAPRPQQAMLEVMVERNWALLSTGQLKELRTLLDRALTTGRFPELLLQDAILRMRERDYAGARTDADEVLARNPLEVRAARIVADSYSAQQQPQKALARLSELAQSHHNSAPLQEILGQWYLSHGKPAEARQSFEAAQTADPGFVPADLALAAIDRLEQRSDAARRHLTAALAGDPKNVPALLMLAAIESDEGNRPEAIKKYRAVLDIESSNLFALNSLAYALALDQPDEALKYAEQAGEIAPHNASVEDTLGWVYYRMGIYGTAVSHLKKAVANEPTPRREFHLGMSYLKSGDRDMAETTLRAALQKEPNLARTERGW